MRQCQDVQYWQWRFIIMMIIIIARLERVTQTRIYLQYYTRCITITLNASFHAATLLSLLAAWSVTMRSMNRGHSPDGSTFLRGMMSWPPSWKCDVMSSFGLRHSMHINFVNSPAKFHPYLIWKEEALDLLRGRPEKKKNSNKVSSDMKVKR